MPQMLYQPGGYTVGVMTCIPASLEHMNTMGHGIVDPVFTQLDSSGGLRAMSADAAQQECLRQQFAATREGLDAIVLDEKRMVRPRQWERQEKEAVAA